MDNLQLSTNIKEATKKAHQSLEKKVVAQLKAIRSEADYASFLNRFYTYFNAVEQLTAPHINSVVLPDYNERRNSSYLKTDITELGETVSNVTDISLPQISTLPQALGAMYVMEGSIMGGTIIVEMLKKYGITKGFSFFSGYGANTGKMWSNFITILNEQVVSISDQEKAIAAANETFEKFDQVFSS